MAKLIEHHEAAKMLGITPDALTDLRFRNAIFGYRDGSTWKYRVEEIERVKESGVGDVSSLDEEMSDLGQEIDNVIDQGDLDVDAKLEDLEALDANVLDLAAEDDSDSILVSEEELGKSDENTASTIIGQADDLRPVASGSDVSGGESDLNLSTDKSDLFSASDILNTLDEKMPSASDTANLSPGASGASSDLKLQSDSGSLTLSLDDLSEGGSSRIELVDDQDSAKASSSGFGSAIDLGLDDDELVLGSGTGSDVTSGPADSGINLANPSDSGLSLEDPLELAAGSSVDSLELGEDEALELDESFAAHAAQADDDFMLTPVEEGMDEESDSGSQVIALDSEEFDESAVGMLHDEDAPVLEAETAEFIDEEVGPRGAALGPTTAGVAVGAVEEEGTYTVWNVLSLFSIVFLLGFTGILMLDLINNIWSWGGNYSFNSTIMDAILGMMPGS
jgi:hypothetical protein